MFDPYVRTIWCIYTEIPEQRYRVTLETNDDNDDGEPDGEVVHATYYVRSLTAAMSLTGKSRTGFAGHRTTVYRDGVRI